MKHQRHYSGDFHVVLLDTSGAEVWIDKDGDGGGREDSFRLSSPRDRRDRSPDRSPRPSKAVLTQSDGPTKGGVGYRGNAGNIILEVSHQIHF